VVECAVSVTSVHDWDTGENVRGRAGWSPGCGGRMVVDPTGRRGAHGEFRVCAAGKTHPETRGKFQARVMYDASDEDGGR